MVGSIGNNNETARQTQVEQDPKNGELESRSGSVESFSEHCGERRDDAIAAGRADSKGRNFAKFDPRDAAEILGKILSQLRKIEKAHLAYVESHQERLGARLRESIDHKEQLIRDIQELEAEIKSLLQDEDEPQPAIARQCDRWFFALGERSPHYQLPITNYLWIQNNLKD